MPAAPSPAHQTTSLDEHPIPRNFGELWNKAEQQYRKETKKDLRTLPIVEEFLVGHEPPDADKVFELLKQQNKSFEAFRDRGSKVLGTLKPIVDVVLFFLDKGADVVSNAIPGGAVVLGAIGVLLETTKGVSRLYDAVDTLLQQVHTFLRRLRVHLEPGPSAPPIPGLMDLFVDILEQVLAALALATRYCETTVEKDSSLKKVGRALFRRSTDYFCVLVDKGGAQAILNRLEEHTQDEKLLTAAANYAATREVQRVTDEDYLRSWLNPPKPQPRSYDQKSISGSCQWFVDDDGFKAWMEQKGGIYWVHGHAGSGKSILCSSAIGALQKNPKRRLAFFYFENGDDTKLDCNQLLSSLVFQIGMKFENGIRYLKSESRSSDNLKLDYAKLLELLSHLLSQSGPMSIVIDALDECPAAARRLLFSFLEHLRDLQSTADTRIDLCILVTSRPEGDIRGRMSELYTHNLDINAAREHAEDIEVFISTRLFGPESTVYYPDWTNDMKWHTSKTLMGKSAGMFLWVVLQLRLLERTAPSAVDSALNELPKGLNETYERILKNFQDNAPSASIATSRRVIECLLYSHRDLSPAEAIEILYADLDSPADQPVAFHTPSHLGDPEAHLLRSCPALLSIVPNDDSYSAAERPKVVRFVHLSVKEYFESATVQQAPTSSPAYPYKTNRKSAHLTLARMCLSTLVADDSHSGFWSYANEYWRYHLFPESEGPLGRLLLNFLSLDSPSFNRWAREHPEGDVIYNALHISVIEHLEQVSKHILEGLLGDPSSSDVVNTPAGYGWTPLHFAAREDFAEICGTLLDYGANTRAPDRRGEIPLHDAAINDQVNAARVLLEHGTREDAIAQCCTRNDGGRTALHMAARYGYIELCRLLLEHGARVDDTDYEGRTAADVAKEEGHGDIVRFLSEYQHSAEASHTAPVSDQPEAGTEPVFSV